MPLTYPLASGTRSFPGGPPSCCSLPLPVFPTIVCAFMDSAIVATWPLMFGFSGPVRGFLAFAPSEGCLPHEISSIKGRVISAYLS